MSQSVPTVARTATLDEYCNSEPVGEEDTYPNGETWCGGPNGEDLPCFGCFDPDQDYNVGDSE